VATRGPWYIGVMTVGCIYSGIWFSVFWSDFILMKASPCCNQGFFNPVFLPFITSFVNTMFNLFRQVQHHPTLSSHPPYLPKKKIHVPIFILFVPNTVSLFLNAFTSIFFLFTRLSAITHEDPICRETHVSSPLLYP
jgi:hypothetical protein